MCGHFSWVSLFSFSVNILSSSGETVLNATKSVWQKVPPDSSLSCGGGAAVSTSNRCQLHHQKLECQWQLYCWIQVGLQMLTVLERACQRYVHAACWISCSRPSCNHQCPSLRAGFHLELVTSSMYAIDPDNKSIKWCSRLYWNNSVYQHTHTHTHLHAHTHTLDHAMHALAIIYKWKQISFVLHPPPPLLIPHKH